MRGRVFGRFLVGVLALCSSMGFTGCSADSNGKTVTEAYVQGLQVNLDTTAEDVDAAGGDTNYCSGRAQFRYAGIKVDIGQFEKGCMESIRKKFGNPDDVTTVFTTSTTAELLNRLNAGGSAHWGVSRKVADSLPAGFKALLQSKGCLSFVFASESYATNALAFGAFENISQAKYLLGFDIKTKKGIDFFYDDEKQPCFEAANRVIVFRKN